MTKERMISVIIPNRNGEATLSRCLDAVFSSDYKNFEVIVVDDGSNDSSVEIAEKYPVRLVKFGEHRGVSEARNRGAEIAKGEILLFIDSDCLVRKDTFKKVNMAMNGNNKVIGGTYTIFPADDGFFNRFQSIYINYCESKKKTDYVAGHCLSIKRDDFLASGGFIKNSHMGHTTSVEDVEFSHRLRDMGFELEILPEIQVRHFFNFNFLRSLHNAFRKSYYWTIYSLRRGDLLKDSGAASKELKFSSLCLVLSLLLSLAGGYFLIPALYFLNIVNSRKLIAHFSKGGRGFAVLATAYFFFIYPIPVMAGSLSGFVRYIIMRLRDEL